MVTKSDIRDNTVDWKQVEKATEIRRTYFVTTKDGRRFFKMYKPSEATKIFKEKGWHGVSCGRIERNKKHIPNSFKLSVRGKDMTEMTRYADRPRTVKRPPTNRQWWKESFG